MTSIKQPYGLRNGKIVSIDNVESGLACNCICPACKQTLIAKKGTDKQHHFAHYNSDDCGKGIETVIHKISKDFFSKSKTFTTPVLKLSDSNIVVFEPTLIEIENVKLEHRLGDIIPDIIIESKGKELIVEITVTHEIEFRKARLIEEKGISTIEIFAKDLYEHLYRRGDLFINDSTFQNELINGTTYKRWIYNDKLKRITNQLKNNYALRYERKTIKFDDYEYLNFIAPCPANKRIWKGGPKQGTSYANIDEDCPICEFCVGLDYKDWVDPKIEFHKHSYPVATYCCGTFEDKFQDLVDLLKT